MQDNEPLMRALSNLINLNEPDLTLFVGEALVGNDAVDQLTKFNQRLADLARTPTAQMIQGLVLTKMDTIDDKVRLTLDQHVVHAVDVFSSLGPACHSCSWKLVRCLTRAHMRAGWSCTEHGLRQRRAHHVCGLWTDLCGLEAVERQISGQEPVEMIRAAYLPAYVTHACWASKGPAVPASCVTYLSMWPTSKILKNLAPVTSRSTRSAVLIQHRVHVTQGTKLAHPKVNCAHWSIRSTFGRSRCSMPHFVSIWHDLL